MATIGNVVIVSVLAIQGILMASVPAAFVLGILTAVMVVTFLLDEIKVRILQNTEIQRKSN